MESAHMNNLTALYQDPPITALDRECIRLHAQNRTPLAQEKRHAAMRAYFLHEPEDLSIPASADIAPNFKECLWLLFWVCLTAFGGAALWGLT